jgi:hypothetical protein
MYCHLKIKIIMASCVTWLIWMLGSWNLKFIQFNYLLIFLIIIGDRKLHHIKKILNVTNICNLKILRIILILILRIKKSFSTCKLGFLFSKIWYNKFGNIFPKFNKINQISKIPFFLQTLISDANGVFHVNDLEIIIIIHYRRKWAMK